MTTEVRDDLKYTETHEWVKVKENTAKIGITAHAQSELTDIVFAELPDIGKQLKKGDELCVVESVKSVSEIYTPVSGKIMKVNQDLEDTPEIINQQPYDDGWLVEIELSHPEELDDLHDAEAYRKLI
ncbi:MAG: glycine cleavage system protein GcvH [Candidatus Thermoplasmatota archaeon]|nr:glycine cleavage system protein GcvH [Candidatus Thermoplasmatota archaeon]